MSVWPCKSITLELMSLCYSLSNSSWAPEKGKADSGLWKSQRALSTYSYYHDQLDLETDTEWLVVDKPPRYCHSMTGASHSLFKALATVCSGGLSTVEVSDVAEKNFWDCFLKKRNGPSNSLICPKYEKKLDLQYINWCQRGLIMWFKPSSFPERLYQSKYDL